jgi:CRISPR-associated endonuclease/helicase Cas3
MNLKINYQLCSHLPGLNGKPRLLKDHLWRVAINTQTTIEELLNRYRIFTTIPHSDLIRAIYIIAACHDVGKGTPYFQTYLFNKTVKVDVFLKSHSMISALYCSWLILHDDTISENNRKFLALAAAIVVQGHHGSLKSSPGYFENLKFFNKQEIFQKQIESFKIHELEMETIMTRILKLKSFKEFCQRWKDAEFNLSHKLLFDEFNFADKMEGYFTINMLFSALIDNDNMDAAELQRPGRLPIDYDLIKNYIKNNFNEAKEIDRLRNKLFRYINNRPINLDNKIYTLTAKTGLGKTLTSVNFALNLRQEIEHRKGYRPRIIYVAPFVSILDQNMEVLQRVFTQRKEANTNLLLMHHHLANVRYHDSIKDEDYTTSQSEFLTHGWNAELIVTTFIQFFNMVFGRYTSQLRRLHNVMGSIIILDEVQSIPFELWDIVRQGLLFLAKKFNFTIILMTATQPLIFREAEKGKKAESVEIAPKIKLPPRVTFVLRNDRKVTLKEFCSEMHQVVSQHKDKNIMIELNTILTARTVFDSLYTITSHNVRFLSSQVIPKHRLPRIHEIKENLADKNKKIVLVTTQVIEAGVDLDFGIAVRDIGPIDSIVQTAGRCNREGDRETRDSLFYVYRIVDDRRETIREYARYIYKDIAIDIANSMLVPKSNIDIESLVQQYYKEIRRRQSMQKSNEIYGYISELDYEKVEKEFLILEDDHYKVPVFVEFDEEATLIWEKYLALSKLNDKKKIKGTAENIQLRNEMGQYMIDINESEVYALKLDDVSGIYKMDNNKCATLYDKEKGFMGMH